MVPFLPGGVVAAAAFIFFGGDLAHHYTAYSPNVSLPFRERVWSLWLIALLAPVIRWIQGRDIDTRAWTAGVIVNSDIAYFPPEGPAEAVLAS